MNWTQTAKEIEADEGLRFHAYKDTEGVTTIGVGRNLESVGISEDEARYLFSNDLRRAYGECLRRIPIFPYSSSPVSATRRRPPRSRPEPTASCGNPSPVRISGPAFVACSMPPTDALEIDDGATAAR